MKKLITLVLTLALCVPMLLTTSIEVKANNICAHSLCGKTVSNGQEVCSTCENKISFKERVITSGSHVDVYLCSACNSRIHQNEESHNQNGDNGVCSVCGYNTVHQHSSNSSTWFRNSIQHWRICNAVDPCNVRVDEGEHNYTEKTPTEHKCGVCGYNAKHVDGDSNGACDKCGYNVTNSNDGSQGSNTPQPSPTPDENEGGNSVPKEEKPAYKAPTAEEIAEWKSAEVEAKIKAEEAIPVSDFVSTAAVNAIPTELKESASTEALYNISKITYTRGFVAAIDKIVKANLEDKTVTLYSDNPFAFNATLLTALENANKDFVYMFKHEGHLYKVTIPAGAKVDLEGQIFAGPLYIGAKLGTTVVVK